MPEFELPKEMADFIAKSIKSLEHLELLLLLSQSEPRAWSAQSAYELIKSNPASITTRLKDLAQQNLLVEEGSSPPTYRFQPADPRLRSLVKDLVALYRERRVRVIEAIYPGGARQVQGLADAFKFKPAK